MGVQPLMDSYDEKGELRILVYRVIWLFVAFLSYDMMLTQNPNSPASKTGKVNCEANFPFREWERKLCMLWKGSHKYKSITARNEELSPRSFFSFSL